MRAIDKDVLSNVKIYTSSERRVIVSITSKNRMRDKLTFDQNTAQIFAHALLGVESGTGSSMSSQVSTSPVPNGDAPKQTESLDPCPSISHLIVRRDLLDDNNAGKEKMNDAKKQLKVGSSFSIRRPTDGGRCFFVQAKARKGRILRGQSRSNESQLRWSRYVQPLW